MATVELLDTTLRDGEQTSGVSFSPEEKLQVTRSLLEDVKIDRIEVASARVSEGELEAVRRIVQWAQTRGLVNRIEVLCFLDGTESIDWAHSAGIKTVNLLTKGSLKHLIGQLRKKPEEHIADIKRALQYVHQKGMQANIYLEDWSNGMVQSAEYVHLLISSLQNEGFLRFMLPDTLGVLTPDQSYAFCKEMVEAYPEIHFDFHAHNDYDLAVANSLAAVRAGVKGVHATINGLGERAGNAPIASVMAVLKDHLKISLNANEAKITRISKLVESFSGIRIPANKPIVGDNVFTQACGVHADGDSKNNLYYNDLLPERFGRTRKYALGKTSGKSNILKNLEELDIQLDPEIMKKVTRRVVELGDRKENVTAEDLPYIIADVLHNESVTQRIRVVNYALTVAEGLKSSATLMIEIEGQHFQETSSGDGQYDAFMNALHKIYARLGKSLPRLADYEVTIPPGGKTDALVETVITWSSPNREFKSRGLDPDQTVAAIKATVKMLNIIA